MALEKISYTANNTSAIQGAYRNKWDGLLSNFGNNTIPKLNGGRVIEIGGAAYLVNGDITITGTVPSSDGTYYIKITPSGDTGAVAWETSASGYTWSESNAGWYASTVMLIPYEVEYRNSGEWLKKQWILPRAQNEKISYVNLTKQNGSSFIDSLKITASTPTEEEIFEFLAPYVPNVGDTVNLSGGWSKTEPSSFKTASLHHAIRTTTTRISVYRTEIQYNSGGAFAGDVVFGAVTLIDDGGGAITYMTDWYSEIK